MVSYFVPRGRFLIKGGSLRQAQKQYQIQNPEKKWPMLQQLRQTFSNTSQSTSNNKQPSKAVTPELSNVSKKKQHDTKNQQQITRVVAVRAQSWWLHWAGILFKWAPVGFFMFGAMEWQWQKQKCTKENEPCRASSFQTKIYCSLPLRFISRCWGWLASCYVPTMFRPTIYGCYSYIFNVNLSEAMYADYKHYESLSDFFTRTLRDDVRPIDQKAPLVSPADGRVLHFGPVTSNSLIEQVKGVDYSMQCFFGPVSWKNQVEDPFKLDYAANVKEQDGKDTKLFQCVIYLAPGDYHRFHSPAEWTPVVRRHFPGKLLSVNPKVANWLPGLFCLNERVLYMGNWAYGFFSYTAVGATNVGSVQIYMDDKLKTNCWLGLNLGGRKKEDEYKELFFGSKKTLDKGELFGQFNMGSTIVLIFEAPKNFVFDIEPGKQVLVGQSLGHLA